MDAHLPANLLLVEDTEGHAQLLALALTDAYPGIQVTTVGTLAEARAAIASHAPDFVAVDYLLPDGSGLELLPGPQTQPAFPILVLTSHGDEQVARDAIKAGALDYLVKSEATFTSFPHHVERAWREWRLLQDQRRLRVAVADAEKQQAISQLAGGIAHDFNNQLAVISGFGELMLMKLEHDSPLRHYVKGIMSACGVTKSLTQQLLAYARRGNYQSVPVNVRQLLEAVISWLQHAAGGNGIKIEREMDLGNLVTLGDPDQLHDAILNVVKNARDAMPEGGILRCSCQPCTLTAADCARNPGFPLVPGDYIQVQLIDSGCGMDATIRQHLFEPFFTTKSATQGRGMGLAAAYGIMLNHRGAIEIESEPGRGTIATLFFPRAAAPARTDSATVVVDSPERALRILLVDDEPNVCLVGKEILEMLGHFVVIAPSAEQALVIYRESWRHLDLVILDMVMPRLSGAELFTELKAINPNVKAVISSGFSQTDDITRTLAAGAKAIIQKPFAIAELSRLLETVA